MRISIHAFLALRLSVLAVPALAQSPNTAAILVVVVDQTGAVVTDAKVSVINRATGATRDADVRLRRLGDHRGAVADRHLRDSA